jgi:regulator of sirC expression with transglutaminase-like and TPR domain
MRGHRKRIVSVVAWALLVAAQLAAAETAVADPVLAAKPKNIEEAIAAIHTLAGKDEKDLTYLGCVITAGRVLQPDIDAAAIEKQVQAIADKIKEAAAGSTSPAARIAACNKVLFQDYGFKTDPKARESVLSGDGSLDASLLHRVLERKQGVCLGLTTLYLVVAERAQLPIYAVHVPNHIFCRYEEGDARINIECTAGGVSMPNRAYGKQMSITDAGMNCDCYFKRLTKKDVLSDQLNNLAYDLATRTKGPEPLTFAQLADLMELGVKMQPRDKSLLDSAALIQFKNGNPARAVQLCDQAIALAEQYGGPAECLPAYKQRRSEYEAAAQKKKQQVSEEKK